MLCENIKVLRSKVWEGVGGWGGEGVSKIFDPKSPGHAFFGNARAVMVQDG